MPAESKAQQRLMGMAYAAKKNKTPNKELSPEVARLKKMLSKKQLKDFAATKTNNLPEHKEKKEDKNTTKRASISEKMNKLSSFINKRASITEKMHKMASSIRTLPSESISELKNTNALNLKQYGRGNRGMHTLPIKASTPNPKIKTLPRPIPNQGPVKRASINEKMNKYAGGIGAAILNPVARALSSVASRVAGRAAASGAARAAGKAAVSGAAGRASAPNFARVLWRANPRAFFRRGWGNLGRGYKNIASGNVLRGAGQIASTPAYFAGGTLKQMGRWANAKTPLWMTVIPFQDMGGDSSAPNPNLTASGHKDISNIFNTDVNPNMWSDVAKIGGTSLGALALASLLSSGMEGGFGKSALLGLAGLGGLYGGLRWAGYNPGDWFNSAASQGTTPATKENKDPSAKQQKKTQEKLQEQKDNPKETNPSANPPNSSNPEETPAK